MPELTRALPQPAALLLVSSLHFVRWDDLNQTLLEVAPPAQNQFPYEAKVEIKEELRPHSFDHERHWPSLALEPETVDLVITLKVPKSQLIIHAQ